MINDDSMSSRRTKLPIALLLSWLALSCASGMAADDDEIVVSTAAATAQEVAEMNVNFDQWIFPGAQTAAVGWQRRARSLLRSQATARFYAQCRRISFGAPAAELDSEFVHPSR